MDQLADLEKTDSKEESSCLKWKNYNGRTKVCGNFKTDTDQLNIAVYRCRRNLYLKDNEIDLKLTEYLPFLPKRVFVMNHFDIFCKRCLVLDETTVHH